MMSVFAVRNFNPRPPWGGRLKSFDDIPYTRHFNPRPPWGGRRKRANLFYTGRNISIHALRGEGDNATVASFSHQRYFNPRPPWGGRHICISIGHGKSAFQSTPSVGRATRETEGIKWLDNLFQSTPSVGRATAYPETRRNGTRRDFNPRPPWGGRRLHSHDFKAWQNFNPRPPWGGRQLLLLRYGANLYFNPRPPWGGRRCRRYAVEQVYDFNPRPPWGGRRPTFRRIGRIF